MNFISKKQLLEYIEEAKESQETEVLIRQVVEEFKHYKQVNKRFTDRLKELGLHAYIDGNKLHVSKHRYTVTLYDYGKALSWDLILSELERMDYKGMERKYQARLNNYDSDIEALDGIVKLLKATKLGCFDLWNEINQLETVVRNGKGL